MCKQDIGFLLKQIGNRLEKNRNLRLREFDVTGAQMDFLLFLYQHREGQISQKDISDYFGICHTSVIDIMKNLERKGFIRREVNPDNARYRCVSLTEKGEAVITSLGTLIDEVEAALLAGFTAVEIDALSCYLQRIYENVERMIAE